MTLKSITRLVLKPAAKSLHVLVLITSLLLSPIAHALQIRLGSNMNLRTLRSDELAKVGMLAAGSIVEIPDKYKVVDRNGRINGTASFNNWLSKAGYSRGEINKRVRDPKLDFYFPVRIVKMAPGSTGSKSLVGKTHFMALRVLAKSKGRLSVNRNSPVYKGPSDDAPLWPQDPEEAQSPVAAEPAQAADEPVVASEPTQPLEASGVCENCGEPDEAPEAAPQAAPIADVASAIDDSVSDQFDTDFRSNRLPKLTPAFFAAGATCEKFIKKDGSGYGPYGQELLRQISEPRMRDLYMSDSNGAAIAACPNFSNLSTKEKEHFWVWTFAALAWQESKCGAVKKDGHLNPGSRASAGLYHIERSKRLREGRDDLYGGTYCSGDPDNLRVNTRCSVRMLATPLGKGLGPWSTVNQYWGPFKHREPGVYVRGKFVKNYTKPLMRQHAKCFAGARR